MTNNNDMVKIPVKGFMDAVKTACSVSRGIIKAEENDKRLRKLLPSLPKNSEARIQIERDLHLFKMIKKQAKPNILTDLFFIEELGLKVKKEDIDVMKKALALCEEGKKVSRAKSRRSPVKKQFTRE